MNAVDSRSEVPPALAAGDKLSGRVALVTGGTRGIGAAICRSLATQGASIAAGYSAHLGRAEQFLKDFEADYPGQGRASIHQGNVSNPEDCRRVVKEVLDELGRLDILVNNAGITIDKMAMKMSVEDWNTVLAVNLSGSFYMAQPALEHMLERGTGRIILVSSVIGEHGNVGQVRPRPGQGRPELAHEVPHPTFPAGDAVGQHRSHRGKAQARAEADRVVELLGGRHAVGDQP